MGPIDGIFVFVGGIAFLLGLFLLFAGVTSRGSMSTEYGKFSGPVWFILIAFGLVLILAGASLPI